MKQCAICQKGSIMAGTRHLLRGHYNPTNWSRKYPNLQKVRMPSGLKAELCMRCKRTLSKARQPADGAKRIAPMVAKDVTQSASV